MIIGFKQFEVARRRTRPLPSWPPRLATSRSWVSRPGHVRSSNPKKLKRLEESEPVSRGCESNPRRLERFGSSRTSVTRRDHGEPRGACAHTSALQLRADEICPRGPPPMPRAHVPTSAEGRQASTAEPSALVSTSNASQAGRVRCASMGMCTITSTRLPARPSLLFLFDFGVWPLGASQSCFV